MYSLPPGTIISNGTTSDVSQLNTPLQDLEADANAARPVVAGGTGATSAADARTNLGVPGKASTETITGLWSFSNALMVINSQLLMNGQLVASTQAAMSTITPIGTNTHDLGSSGLRWKDLYLVNSPSVSSDARLKTEIADLTDAELRAAAKIKVRTFKMGGKKRVGYVAQEIIEAMKSEGLDAFEYSLVFDGDFLSVDYDAVSAFRDEAKRSGAFSDGFSKGFA